MTQGLRQVIGFLRRLRVERQEIGDDGDLIGCRLDLSESRIVRLRFYPVWRPRWGPRPVIEIVTPVNAVTARRQGEQLRDAGLAIIARLDDDELRAP